MGELFQHRYDHNRRRIEVLEGERMDFHERLNRVEGVLINLTRTKFGKKLTIADMIDGLYEDFEYLHEEIAVLQKLLLPDSPLVDKSQDTIIKKEWWLLLIDEYESDFVKYHPKTLV